MFKWPYEKYEGNKSEFRDPYLEQLKQQLRAGNCYRIATGEEKEVIDANVEDLNGIDLKLQEKTAEWERRNMLGFAIISMSISSTILNKINKDSISTCHGAYKFLETKYGGKLSVAEMAHIDRLLDRKIGINESAETFIEKWLQLHLQSGIERNEINDVRLLARLTKLFEDDGKFINVIKLCYLTNKDLEETIQLIIKEDEKDKIAGKINEDNNKVKFKEKDKEELPSIMK